MCKLYLICDIIQIFQDRIHLYVCVCVYIYIYISAVPGRDAGHSQWHSAAGSSQCIFHIPTHLEEGRDQ